MVKSELRAPYEAASGPMALIRIAIEFCVTIQDCYFLFYDLFLMFQEEALENIFLDELKPFIMAGRFQDWDLPDDILQNHIINYYKDPHQPELIEKIIINLFHKVTRIDPLFAMLWSVSAVSFDRSESLNSRVINHN